VEIQHTVVSVTTIRALAALIGALNTKKQGKAMREKKRKKHESQQPAPVF